MSNNQKTIKFQLNPKERISFFVNSDLAAKIEEISGEINITISEFARQAILNYIKQLEKEKICKELESGYKDNIDYYLKMQEEWNFADNE
jgi:ribbon-helix-helix protein